MGSRHVSNHTIAFGISYKMLCSRNLADCVAKNVPTFLNGLNLNLAASQDFNQGLDIL